MAVTRSRAVHKYSVYSSVKKEEPDQDVVPLKLQFQRSNKIKTESDEAGMSLRSKETLKVHSAKQKQDLGQIFTRLRPSYDGRKGSHIGKKTLIKIRHSKTSKATKGTTKITDFGAAQLKVPQLKSVLNEVKNHRISKPNDCKRDISISESQQEPCRFLSDERARLSSTLKELYNYQPTWNSLLKDIRELPNFSKQAHAKRIRARHAIKKCETGTPGTKTPVPLTLPSLYKDLSMNQITVLKQTQLLKVCGIFNLRLKNIDFEKEKFDLSSANVIDKEELYPMDCLHLREDDGYDDTEDQTSEEGFAFLLEGLNKEDYMVVREFDERPISV